MIMGRNSREIETILGYAGRAEMVHRDDLVLRYQPAGPCPIDETTEEERGHA